jgi:hypothetical protein
MYEHRRERPLSFRHFALRLLAHLGAASLLVAGSLLVGMWGYQRFESLDPLSAFLNSAMLLGGMGPVDMPRTPGGKLFAGLYALYAGLVFLVVAGLLLAPVIHRVLHRLHFEDEDGR